MRIAFLHLTMGLVERGSEVVIDSLAQALSVSHSVLVLQAGPVSKRSYTVKRVNPLDQAPPPAPRNILDKLLFRLHLNQESEAVLSFTKSSLADLVDFQPEIIVAVNGPLQLKILRAAFPSVKLVAFGHAGIGYHDRDTLLAGPDLFFALTRPAEAWARSHARKITRVTYLPNPLNLSSYAKTTKAKLKLDRPVVLTVSALSSYKNVRSVLEGIRLTPASWLLIGDGEQGGDISSSLSNLNNSFLWIKHVESDRMPSYYRAADVFCFTPDSQEAFGMVYLEAMAAGLPIVASNDKIRRELIGKQGIYVDPRNPAEIASGISQAIQLGRISYSEQLKPYALKTIVSQLEHAFYDLLS